MKKGKSDWPSCGGDDPRFDKRRSLLLGCLSLPVTSVLSILGGCGGDDNGVGSSVEAAADIRPAVPLPPFSPADAPPPTSSPATPALSAPVTHVPTSAPTPSGSAPVIMNVAVFNAEFNSFNQNLPRRQVAANTPGAVSIPDPSNTSATLVYEDIRTYLKRTLDSKFALLNRAMLAAFSAHRPSEFDVSFVTAPEFFWNAPWGEFVTLAEVADAADFYMSTVTDNIRKLMARFPACRYGNIVLLPGTIAVLKPSATAKDKNGNPVYLASNWLVCTHNLPTDDPHHPRPAYMIWPKRTVSTIDFIDGSRCGSSAPIYKNPVNPLVDNSLLSCVLSQRNGLTVSIEQVTSDLAQSFDASGKLLSSSFKNNIVQGLPFGIDICLDYATASAQENPFRMAELDDRRFKIDFVLAAGMKLSVSNYATTPYIQYAIHNDGIQGSNENYREEAGRTIDVTETLYSDIWKLQFDRTTQMIYGDLATPLDSASPFDTAKGVIAVPADDSFKAPADVDMKNVPAITDTLNAMQVRVWQLPVDVTDTGTYSADISAMAPSACTS